MNKYKLILIAIVCIFIGFSIEQVGKDKGKVTKKLKLSNAIPTWVPFRKDPNLCLEPTEGELLLFENSALSLEALNKEQIFHSSLHIGIHKFLSHGMYRSVGKERISVCTPKNFYKRISKSVADSKSMKAYIVQYQLILAGLMEEPSDSIVEQVAKVAFSLEPHPNRGEWPEELDLRPLARTVLASYGKASQQYSAKAFSQITAKSSLGTGAAQIAAATEHAGALDLISELMEEVLMKTSSDEVIKFKDRLRLYELAYALYFSKKQATPYLPVLRDLMRRKVASGSSFGTLSLHPKQMCHIMEEISGQIDKEFSYCFDKEYPFPQ